MVDPKRIVPPLPGTIFEMLIIHSLITCYIVCVIALQLNLLNVAVAMAVNQQSVSLTQKSGTYLENGHSEP